MKDRFRRILGTFPCATTLQVVLSACFIPMLVLLVAGCTRAHYRESADKEVYGIVRAKSAQVPGMQPEFTIERVQERPPLEGLPVVQESDPALGARSEAEMGAAIVGLEEALHIAVVRNRQYQNRKEAVYLAVLSLTLERHRYTPIFSGALSGAYQRSTADVSEASSFSDAVGAAGVLIDQIEEMTGTPASLLTQYAGLVEEAGGLAGLDEPSIEIEDERSLSGQTSFGMDLLLRGGGRIALNLTSNFLRFLTGDPRTATGSALTAAFTQPLLRGTGHGVAVEQLTQAERDALYALREFTRFRKEFTVDICSKYYDVLQARDRVRNNYQSYLSFQRAVERERAFAQEGRRTLAELGRLEQALLNNENEWINAVRRYKEGLDQFKIQLGLSTDSSIVLDSAELDTLLEQGLLHPDIGAAEAVDVAHAARLDYYTELDRLEDAQRKVLVAADALEPGLDLIIDARADSTGQDNFQEIDFRRAVISGGFDVDLPLDRKAERNAYRAALIDAARAERDLELKSDNIKLEVRAAWRDLDQARRNYEIALQSLELNQRRVEEQDLLAELGLATALDQVDAQNDLTQAQNNLTDALINHTLARLRFWRDMGILFIKPNGQWEEVTDEFSG